jgi:hypothetical protein
MARKMRPYQIALSGAIVAGAFAFVLVRRGPQWEAVDEGPVKGVAWARLTNSDAISPEVGRPKNLGTHFSAPNDFVYRLPAPTANAEPFLLIEGKEIPLRANATFQDRLVRSVQPIREYPPRMESLDLVIKSPGLKDSHFRMRHLPPTRYRFPVHGTATPSQETEGVRIEAAAWTEDPIDGYIPYIAGAIRVVGTPPGSETMWEWRDVAMETPFQSPEEPERTPGRITAVPLQKVRALGLSESHPWAGAMPRLRLSGRLSAFEEVEDVVDFGEFEVFRHMEHTKVDFALRMDKPVLGESVRGVKVRLEPITIKNQGHGEMFPPMLSLRLVLDPATAQIGMSDAMRASKGESVVVVSLPHAKTTQQIRKESYPDAPTNFIEYQGLELGKKIRLKLRFLRRVAVREIPFTLYPDVTRRPSPVKSITYMRKTREDTSSTFQPTEEDFHVAATRH